MPRFSINTFLIQPCFCRRTLVVGAVGVVAGAAVTTVAIPAALGAIGFTGAGIAGLSHVFSFQRAVDIYHA